MSAIASVNARGAVVLTADRREVEVPWEELRAAAAQDDSTALYYLGRSAPPQDDETRRLAACYRAILATARDLAARTGPVDVGVEQDETGVWWVAYAQTWDGVDVSGSVRASDEGGTHAHASGAQGDADAWARRLRARGRTVRS